MKSALFVVFAATVAYGQSCRWGLIKTTDCDSVEVEAAERLASAKTVCLSSDSGVTWPKTLRNPQTAQALLDIGRAYRFARRGYEQAASCDDADLIFKFQVEKGDRTDLEVFDADSGDRVFYESRGITDQAADLHRLAIHFEQAHRTALANKVRWDSEEKQEKDASVPH